MLAIEYLKRQNSIYESDIIGLGINIMNAIYLLYYTY